jgi:EAL domain-containing protein (putative c-di-GMP-specific phosphodiesterase class I)
MVFQPVVDLKDSSVAGYEALARFEGGSDPVAWFRDAEGVGLGPELELSAIRAALRALHALESTAFLALNVSPLTLVSGRLDGLFAEDLAAAAQRSQVVIELTEHVPVADYPALLSAFAPLRQAGAKLAVDDTGAGYAGLRHLLHLHPDVIKLDLSLVSGICDDPVRRALATALLSFAADIGARLIAEGVETTAQARTLSDLGVTWAQGWLFGRPAASPQVAVAGG